MSWLSDLLIEVRRIADAAERVADQVAPVDTANPPRPRWVRVIVDRARLYNQPGNPTKPAAYALKGEKMQLLGTAGDYVRIGILRGSRAADYYIKREAVQDE